mgnify:CR=1 FL=1
MWKSFLDRIKEPSTWAGLALTIGGIGQVADIKEAPMVADAVGGMGQALSSGADPISAGVMALAGIAAMFLKEKGRR